MKGTMRKTKGVFACECGIQFGRSQEKASHCKSCKVHKYFKDAQAQGGDAKALLARDGSAGSDALASSLNISEQFDDCSVIAGTVISSLGKEALGGDAGKAGPPSFSPSAARVVLPPLSYVISGEKRPGSDPAPMLPPLKKVQCYTHVNNNNKCT